MKLAQLLGRHGVSLTWLIESSTPYCSDSRDTLDGQSGPLGTQLARAMVALSTAEARRERVALRGTSGHGFSFVNGASTNNNHHAASFELKALRAPVAVTGLTCYLNEAGAARDQITVSVFTTRTPITRLEQLEYNSTPESRTVWTKEPEWQKVFVNQDHRISDSKTPVVIEFSSPLVIAVGRQMGFYVHSTVELHINSRGAGTDNAGDTMLAVRHMQSHHSPAGGNSAPFSASGCSTNGCSYCLRASVRYNVL